MTTSNSLKGDAKRVLEDSLKALDRIGWAYAGEMLRIQREEIERAMGVKDAFSK